MDPRLPLALLGVLSLAFAGCVGDPSEADTAALDPAPSVTLAAADVPVAWDGSFGLRAATCGPAGCFGQTVAGETERLYEVEGVAGDLAHVLLTLTWTAAAPTNEELGFGIVSCAGECASDADVTRTEFVSGPSPLVLDVSDFPLGPDDKLLLFVNSAGLAPMVYVTGSAPQDFHVEGLLTPAAAEASSGGNATA